MRPRIPQKTIIAQGCPPYITDDENTVGMVRSALSDQDQDHSALDSITIVSHVVRFYRDPGKFPNFSRIPSDNLTYLLNMARLCLIYYLLITIDPIKDGDVPFRKMLVYQRILGTW